MLKLTRKADQTIVIETPSGETIVIDVCQVRQKQVRLGITADKSVKIYRGEVFEQIEEHTKLDLVGS